MQEAIAKFGLVDLASYLPKKPTPEQLAIIFEMFQASLDGEMYDPARWSQHYKPFGFDSAPSDDAEGDEGRTHTPRPAASRPAAPAPVAKPAPQASTDEDDIPPFEADTPKTEVKTEATAEAKTDTATAGKSPQEILAMLRNRNK